MNVVVRICLIIASAVLASTVPTNKRLSLAQRAVPLDSLSTQEVATLREYGVTAAISALPACELGLDRLYGNLSWEEYEKLREHIHLTTRRPVVSMMIVVPNDSPIVTVTVAYNPFSGHWCGREARLWLERSGDGWQEAKLSAPYNWPLLPTGRQGRG